MNCNDIRKYFYAFIDNELDVEKNIEILAHLDMCYECSQKIEKERLLHKRVKETVCMVKAPAYLEHNILKSVEKKPSFFTLLKENLLLKSRLIPLTAIATVVIIAVSFFVIQSNLKKNDIIYLAESEYHNYMMQQLDLDIRSQDPGTIEKYLQKQTNSNIVLPEIKDDVTLIGAALSEIEGVKVSQVYYMHDETPVSLMIICYSDSQLGYSKNIDFSGMKEILIDEKVVYYDDKGYCGHCQIMGWKEAENQYVMVSNLNSDKMMRILKKA
ncbi:MAG: anti-sigma factor family protein [Candidatus Scalinduaceae bacterium]